MRRSAALLLIVAVIAVAIWATGVVTVHVNPPKTELASASPFWQEKGGEALGRLKDAPSAPSGAER